MQLFRVVVSTNLEYNNCESNKEHKYHDNSILSTYFFWELRGFNNLFADIYFLLPNPLEDHLSLNEVSKSHLESGFVHSKSLFVTYASIKDDKTQGKGWKENNKSYLSRSGAKNDLR